MAMYLFNVDIVSTISSSGYEIEASTEAEAIERAWEVFYEDLKSGDVIFEDEENYVKKLETIEE